MNAEMSKTIKKVMIDKDVSMAQLARELNVTRQNVSQIILGKRKSERVIKYLEKRLDIRIIGE